METESSPLPEIKEAFEQIRKEVSKVIVGQDETLELLLITILADAHCVLEGGPGSARVLLAETLAQTLGLSFRRIRCTSELTSEEVTGEAFTGDPYDKSERSRGLIVGNVVLVDDISRLRPRALSVVQQAMQDRDIQIHGQRYPLPKPFIVLASKYRRDTEPADVEEEPRDDRFLMKIATRFPDYHNEYHMATTATSAAADVKPVLSSADVIALQQQVLSTDVPPPVVHYAVRLVRATRVHEGENPDFIYEWVSAGAGPRAVHHLTLAAKVRAALHGRESAAAKDVRAVVHSVLRHRVVTNQNARSNGITPDGVIDRLIYELPDRVAGDESPPGPGESLEIESTSAADFLDERLHARDKGRRPN